MPMLRLILIAKPTPILVLSLMLTLMYANSTVMLLMRDATPSYLHPILLSSPILSPLPIARVSPTKFAAESAAPNFTGHTADSQEFSSQKVELRIGEFSRL